MKIHLVVVWLFLFSFSNAGDAHAKGEITQLKLQRTECYGLCPVEELTLNADGNAQYAGVSGRVARKGFYRGQIAPEKFAALVQALEEQNFFELRPQIGDLVTDVPDIIISATRKNSLLDQPYTVAARYAGRSALLEKLSLAFAQASAQIEWTKDQVASEAGVRGIVQRNLTPYETKLFADRKPQLTSLRMRYVWVKLIAAGDTKTVYSTHSDNEGHFQVFAPPGKYLLAVNDFNAAYKIEDFPYLPLWLSDGKWIEIQAGQFLPIEAQLHDHNEATKSEMGRSTGKN